MDRHDLAAGELDIGEEPLVAAEKAALHEGRREAHRRRIAFRTAAPPASATAM
jgi:hypothetical protein